MPGFDPNLDKEIWSEKAQVADNMNIKVSVMSYNEGVAKLQLTRERLNREGQPQFAKLGRMTLDEVKAIQPLIEKAVGILSENQPAEAPAEE
ncbi:hypothetical protein KY362_05590 [Candidatus Woesearchaeota archaeon]|nr:hypothetical protein [Candidatus Woesearchaeota archaeon]